jgi:type IV pilus assembly protein PilB
MEVKKSITQKVIIPEDLSIKLQKEITGIPALNAAIQTNVADSTLTITKIIEVIFAGSIVLDASDIHLEPEENSAKLRIRLDGVLQDVMTFPTKSYKQLLSRVKLLAEMKLNVTDRPQDGRFSILVSGGAIEIRASILPAEYGESIVLRILNPKSLISLEQAGLRKDLYDTFLKEIARPNGMVIVTGPTGSGKTTTLYAFLKKIATSEIKIITIEDPIEYHLAGVSQTQVDPAKGYDFASGLRAIVRQDPDVILVGEIRDLETTDIALQAALTGHLVFSTLHTNDAAGTIARLVSLGAKPFNIGPAINMAIAQRLVRRVCPKCATMVTATADGLAVLKQGIASALPDLAKKGVATPKIDSLLKIPHAKGCQACNNTGYRGRIGIYEAFLIDEEIQKYILAETSIVGLKEMARKKGMLSMYQDGLIKVLQGVTTLDEIGRVAEA